MHYAFFLKFLLIAGQLNLLKEMYKSGDLTREEFSKAKKKVLGSE